MSKKVINQNRNYDTELLKSIESNFIFDENPINRIKNSPGNLKKKNGIDEINKEKALDKLKLEINSINDCNLKNNSKNIVLGDGNINSSIMLVGEAPGIEEDNTGQTFLGEVGNLLEKMLCILPITIIKNLFVYIVENKKQQALEEIAKLYSKNIEPYIVIEKLMNIL